MAGGATADSLTHPLTRTLLALTVTAGMVDAVSFLALGPVFTNTMNGNVLLLGFGLAGDGGLPVLAPIVSLVAFVTGAMLGGTLGQRIGTRSAALGVTLAIEVTLVCAAGVVALAVNIVPGHVSTGVVIGLLAFAMGVRTATVRRLAVPDLSTTLVTLAIAGMAADLPTHDGSPSSLRRRGAAVVAMFGGALVGALLLQVDLALTLFATAALSLLAGLAYLADG